MTQIYWILNSLVFVGRDIYTFRKHSFTILGSKGSLQVCDPKSPTKMQSNGHFKLLTSALIILLNQLQHRLYTNMHTNFMRINFQYIRLHIHRSRSLVMSSCSSGMYSLMQQWTIAIRNSLSDLLHKTKYLVKPIIASFLRNHARSLWLCSP